MAVDVYQSLKDLIDSILSDPEVAQKYAEDPYGTLAEQGITDGDLSQVDVQQLVGECAAEADLPPSTQQALQSYSEGAPPPAGSPVSPPPPAPNPGAQEIVQHLNYVTYATYEGDEHITQQLINQENYDYSTHIDNSVDVEVDGDVHGDLDVETTNVNATGDGAVAAGDDVENAATGDGSQIIDGDNHGQANTGDGAVQVGRDLEAPVNTGENSGILADGDANNNVIGDDNQTANVEGSADNSVINFGDGDVTNFGDADIDDSAVSVGGGDANNVSDNTLYEGAAAAAGGDAEGNFEEVDVDVDVDIDQESHVEAYDSNVNTQQGEGEQDVKQELEQEQEEPAGL